MAHKMIEVGAKSKFLLGEAGAWGDDAA